MIGNTFNRTALCLGNTGALPKELVDFARRQVVNALLYKGDERRREERHPMLLPVRAVEVDEDNDPIGMEMNLITRDISPSSIGLIYTDPIRARRMAIQFMIAGTEVNMVIEVIWNGPLGPFNGAAGRFVEKLRHFPD